jgi:hypothetical protein
MAVVGYEQLAIAFTHMDTQWANVRIVVSDKTETPVSDIVIPFHGLAPRHKPVAHGNGMFIGSLTDVEIVQVVVGKIERPLWLPVRRA